MDCTAEDGAGWLNRRNSYRPSDEPYPQLIQGQEYEVTDAIATLYSEASPTRKFGEFGVDDQYDCQADASTIVIHGPKKTVSVELSDHQVRIGRRSFGSEATVTLFRAFARLLIDLGSQCRLSGARGRRLRTRAYREKVVFEFDYGPVVVTLASASNGPTDPERLYVLDLIPVERADLWRPHRTAPAE